MHKSGKIDDGKGRIPPLFYQGHYLQPYASVALAKAEKIEEGFWRFMFIENSTALDEGFPLIYPRSWHVPTILLPSLPLLPALRSVEKIQQCRLNTSTRRNVEARALTFNHFGSVALKIREHHRSCCPFFTCDSRNQHELPTPSVTFSKCPLQSTV